MDDLEHSVYIAEQDWENFYEESEECSIQEARLAGLDDSLLSDTDDEKKSTQESIVLHQDNRDKLNEGQCAEAQVQSGGNCEAGKTESFEWLGDRTDKDKFDEQMAVITLNDATTCAYFTSDSSTSDKVISPTDQQQNASETKNFREHDQSCSEDKLDQATGEQIQDTGYVVSSEKETVSKVLESSATPKKEKERWFVTVNDSPTKLRIKSGTYGQKKDKKKKSSRRLVKQTIAMKEQSLISNWDKEAEQEEIKKGHKLQDESQLPPKTNCDCINSKTCPNDVHEALCSSSIQEILHPAKETDDSEKTVPKMTHTFETSLFTTRSVIGCSFNFESNTTSDAPTENLESHSCDFPNSSSQFIPKNCPQIQTDGLNYFMEQLGTNEKSAKEPKRIICSTNPDHSMTDNISHVLNDSLEDPSRLNLKACSCIELEELQEQTEDNFSFHQETQNLEPPNEVLEAAVGSTSTIYIQSSFWDEMEKRTINDILHLRSTHSSCPSSRTVSPDEIDFCHKEKVSSLKSAQDSLMDDTADSDYFTQGDESKPECSSCEFSNFSDFDEEYLQILNTTANPSPEPQEVKEQTEDPESTYATEQEVKLITMNSESESVDFKLCPQNGVPQYLSPTIEEQNIFHTNELGGKKKTPSPILTVGNVQDDQRLLTFLEILSKDSEVDGPQMFYPYTHCCSFVSFPYIHNVSLHGGYDDFFSDYKDRNFFCPTMQDKTVPIFSTSGSVVRQLVFPGVKDVIGIHIENNNFPIRVKTPFSSPLEMYTSYSEMCFFSSQKCSWNNFIYPRRIMFIVKGSVWCQKVSSWIFPKEAIKATSCISGAQQIVTPLHLGNTALQQFSEQQEGTHQNVLMSKREGILFSVHQTDMCLACIALASWVLKSSNPQSTNMWKAVLLANVSVFSAIQYLRKYEKEETTDDL